MVTWNEFSLVFRSIIMPSTNSYQLFFRFPALLGGGFCSFVSPCLRVHPPQRADFEPANLILPLCVLSFIHLSSLPSLFRFRPGRRFCFILFSCGCYAVYSVSVAIFCLNTYYVYMLVHIERCTTPVVFTAVVYVMGYAVYNTPITPIIVYRRKKKANAARVPQRILNCPYTVYIQQYRHILRSTSIWDEKKRPLESTELKSPMRHQ